MNKKKKLPPVSKFVKQLSKTHKQGPLGLLDKEKGRKYFDTARMERRQIGSFAKRPIVNLTASEHKTILALKRMGKLPVHRHPLSDKIFAKQVLFSIAFMQKFTLQQIAQLIKYIPEILTAPKVNRYTYNHKTKKLKRDGKL